MNKLNYSWDAMHNDTYKIASWIREIGFKPDGVIGLARGGVIPAAILSHVLDCPAHFVNWSLRDGKQKEVKKLDKLAVEATGGKKFIIVDDIVDSGETVATIRQRMFDTDKNVLYTALWFNPAQSRATVNFHANVIDRSLDSRWVAFPWEYYQEDHPATEVKSANSQN